MKYLLPGMGATSAMYSGLWQSYNETTAVDWPEYSGEETIGEVAERLIDTYDLRSTDIIIGSSLGGLVGLDIHRRINLKHIFLLGSALSKEEINPFLLAMAPLAKVTPMGLIRYLAGKNTNVNDLLAMFAEVDAEFVRAMCLDIRKWNGYNGSLKAISRIHGDCDKVIKCPNDAYIIAGGGHLIAITHAEKCIEIIDKLK